MKKLNTKTDLEKYLENGELTKPFLDTNYLRRELNKIANERKTKNLDSDIEQCLLDFVCQNLKGCEDKKFIVNNQFSRTAKEIFESHVIAGCTDYAYVFATLARQVGIPTTILQTAQKEWANKLINNIGDTKKHYGHTFCESFLNGKWVLIDPTNNQIDWKYKQGFKIHLDDWKIDESRTFLPYFRGLDLEEKMSLKQFCAREEKIVKQKFSKIYNTNLVKQKFELAKTPEELKLLMDETLSYGYIDIHNVEHPETMRGVENHRVLNIEEIFNYKYETCAEAAKFAKYWFDKNGYECKLFFERIKRHEHETDEFYNHSTHFYILFKDKKNGWCRFEQSSPDSAGITVLGNYENAIKHIIDDVEITRKNQIDFNKDRDVDFDVYGIYEFKDIEDGWTYKIIDKMADKLKNILNEKQQILSE